MNYDLLADLSRVLYFPTTMMLYLGAAFIYLYALTMSVGRADERERGVALRRIGGVLAILGIGTHVAHEITRGLAQQRLPLGNMFEVTSLMALVGVVAGLFVLQFVRRRGELNGFVLLAGSLVLGMAMLMYSEPGPLMPILDTWWRPFHVSLLVGAMGIFGTAFAFNGLYLLRDTAERAVARSVDAAGTGGPGAAHVNDVKDLPEGASADEEERAQLRQYHAALRHGINPLKLSIGVFLGASLVSWVWLYAADALSAGLSRFLTVNLSLVAAALIARWFVPFLPSTSSLDGLAHRLTAFAFVLWTVGVIAGAMWAEVSWGRFWGWDPKETGSFLTWIAYAGYLHARATHGVKGRNAAWIGVWAFVILMGTYLIANYVVVGLHSYANL
jgi:ABC-type transport system involved in cytochrome c biogenesis permease subunit